MLRDAVAYFVDRVPHNFFDIDRVRVQDLVGLGNNVFHRGVADGAVIIFGHFAQIDIESEQEATLTWDQQDIAADPGLDSAFLTNIREISVRKNIHDTPRMVSLIAVQLISQRFAHVAASAVCTDNVFGADLKFFTNICSC